MNVNLSYPPMPEGAELSVVKPSTAFKKSVTVVVLSMLFFIAIYLFILAAAFALIFAVGAAAIALVSAVHNFWVLVLSLSLVLSTVMLFYFLIKFMFKKQQTDYSEKFELTEEEQPELFQFILELTVETQCPFPKKIYLTADVNAAVFYDTSFWNLFFPAKKNLQIGLGLVNTLNLSELKAVLAHEFGHFSQRSMKLGIYSYSLHRIIYNMIYENDGYYENMRAIGQIHGVVALGISLNLFVVKQIQKLMVSIYNMVNKNYLRLSREMEFHADAVAGYVAGSNQMINCLRRIEFADLCYNEALVFLNKLGAEKKRPANIYLHHKTAISFFADTQQLQADELGLPVIDKKIPSLNNTQINIENQWASHPSMKDREAHLLAVNLNTPTSHVAAWNIFREPEKLQVALTNIVYAYTPERYDIIEEETVQKAYTDFINENSLNKQYKGFYNGRLLTIMEVDDLAQQPSQFNTFESLFTPETCNLPNRLSGLAADIAALDYITASKEIKTFDFKGAKYESTQTEEVKMILIDEQKEAEAELELLDKQAFQFFYHHSKNPDAVLSAYKNLLTYQEQGTAHLDFYKEMADCVNPIFTTMPFNAIEETVNGIYEKEKELKPHLQELINDEVNAPHITTEQRKHLDMYLSKDWVYFNHPDYDDPSILVLTQALSAYYNVIIDRLFGEKKRLTDMQLSSLISS